MRPGGIAGAIVVIAAVAAVAWYELRSDCGDCGQGPSTTEAAEAPATPGPRAAADARPAVPPGAFDYYLLALSWSPSYCLTDATARDRLQCGGAPHAFIVHGLWPQNERGYPEDCPTDSPRVPDALVDEMLDIMPSRGLVGHQWRQHGACTGLSQEDYFAQVRAAFEAVAQPARFTEMDREANLPPRDVMQDFLRANKGLTPDAIVVTCDGALLDEVRICMDKQLRFRPCGPQSTRSSCRRDSVSIPPVAAER